MEEDLLTIIGDCVEENRPIKEADGKIYLGGRCFNSNIETDFPIKQLKKHKGTSQKRKFYNLSEVLFFFQNRTIPHQEYVRKAQEKKLLNVWRMERKPLLTRLYGDPAVRSRAKFDKSVSQKSLEHSSQDQSSPALRESEKVTKKLRLDKNINKNEREKPRVRTYSRKQSSHGLRPSSRRQSSENEDQCSLMMVPDNLGSDSDELVSTKNDELNLEMSLKAMTTFLKDYLGLNAEQLKLLQDGIISPDELGSIASEVKSNIVLESRLLYQDQSSLIAPKYCYKAVKHPVRGWEMAKEDLASALCGIEDYEQDPKLEDSLSAAIEDCIAKGSIQLKRSISVLISQMKEFNQHQKSLEESEMFSKKIIEDCLLNAVDSFEEMFSSLVSSQSDGGQVETIEKWVDLIKAELGKLFQSLARTLQSLRDIPANHQNPPLTLFHLPEPTFSLALNPAKVTHSVVLEMYFRIGLAELRRIVMLLMGFDPQIQNTISNVNFSNENVKDCYFRDVIRSHEFLKNKPQHEDSSLLEETHQASPQMASFQTHGFSAALQYEGEPSKLENRPGASTSTSTVHSLQRVLLCANGRSRTGRNSSRRSSESDYFHQYQREYKSFKASLGSTLVSSFKKQIQEKIQASNKDNEIQY